MRLIIPKSAVNSKPPVRERAMPNAPKCQSSALVRACLRHTRAAPLPSCSHCLTEHLLRACHTLTRARTICNALSAQELATRCMLMLNSLVRVQWHDLEQMQVRHCARLPLPALPAARPCAEIYLDTWRWAPVRNSVSVSPITGLSDKSLAVQLGGACRGAIWAVGGR